MFIVRTHVQVYTRAYIRTRYHAHTQKRLTGRENETKKKKLDIFLPRR